MKGGIGDIMKQAQEMQANFQKAQEEISKLEVTGESGAGLVKIVMNGRHEVKSTIIDDTLVNGDKEMLEDLISAAINDACKRVENASKDKMSGLTSGLNLPPGFKLPF